jgi:PII-like signaling protein
MEFRDASLLRIFFSEDDAYGELPLHDAILRQAHEMKLAGATVLRGIGGYGSTSLHVKYHQFKTEARPIVVEIIDSEEKIAGFLPTIEAMLAGGGGGSMSLDKVRFCAIAPAGT